MKVRVEWDGYNWIAAPAAGGVTAARRLDLVPERVVDVVRLMTGAEISAEDVELEVVVPGTDTGADYEELARLRGELVALEAELATRTASTARALRDRGFSLRDIGTITGLSHQRVHQLLR